MKTTLLTIALTAASLPLTFAAQTMPAKPAAPAAKSSTAVAPKTVVKKHSKSTKKSIAKSTAAPVVKK